MALNLMIIILDLQVTIRLLWEMKKMYFWLNYQLIKILRLMLGKIKVWRQKTLIKLIRIRFREVRRICLIKN